MSVQPKLRNRCSLIVASLTLFGCLILMGCGSEEVDPAERIQAGADFLFALAEGHFQAGWEGRNSGFIGGGATWEDEYVAYVDEERLPDWVENRLDTCVYWERVLSYDAMNRDRQPGEPSRFTFEGVAWGWILMRTDGIHVLELGFEFDGQTHLFVDQWTSQP